MKYLLNLLFIEFIITSSIYFRRRLKNKLISIENDAYYQTLRKMLLIIKAENRKCLSKK